MQAACLIYKHRQERQDERPNEWAQLRIQEPGHSTLLRPMPAPTTHSQKGSLPPVLMPPAQSTSQRRARNAQIKLPACVQSGANLSSMRSKRASLANAA